MSFLTEVSGPPADTLPPEWIFDQIEAWATRVPDRIAFVLDANGRIEEYRYPDVLEWAAAIAAELEEKGIRHGDRIGILMENTPRWVFVLLGAMEIGAVTVPLATTLPEHSIELITRHAGCRLIFADEPNWDKAVAVGQKLTCEVFPIAEARAKAGAASRQKRSCDPASTAILIYTSGTTGN